MQVLCQDQTVRVAVVVGNVRDRHHPVLDLEAHGPARLRHADLPLLQGVEGLAADEAAAAAAVAVVVVVVAAAVVVAAIVVGEAQAV